MRLRMLRHIAAILTLGLAAGAAQAQPGPALDTAVASPARSANNVARDPYRHPVASLTFWGLRPGMTIVELDAGKAGYWNEILVPYAAATGGRYIDTPGGKEPGVTVSLTSGPIAPAGSADMVLTARNIHNMLWKPGLLDKTLKDFHDVLRPNGILAIEEHRADPLPQVDTPDRPASTGYVSVATVVDAARKAGFRLEARSEINANPKDIKTYPFGVWTLPPNRTSASASKPALSAEDRAKFDAIGESDRMTLRFRKVG